jgi:hypothetical protein
MDEAQIRNRDKKHQQRHVISEFAKISEKKDKREIRTILLRSPLANKLSSSRTAIIIKSINKKTTPIN